MLSPENEPRKQLPTLTFDQKKDEWVSLHLNFEDLSLDFIEDLTFVTYNVWHNEENFEERSKEVLRILEKNQTDFVCLQELSQKFLTKLLDSPFVRNEYYIPELPQNEGKDTTMILSKHPCLFFKKQWPSRMDRFLLYCALEVNSVPTAIATVHLESQIDSPFRKRQLDITFEQFKLYPRVIILGDFNFDWRSENQNISPDYVDVWPLLHPGTPGPTMSKTHDFFAWRPDKILLKKHKKYKPMELHRIGMESFSKLHTTSEETGKDVVQTPSDHFGLKFAIRMLDDSKEEWSSGHKEKTYKKEKSEHYVWIDSSKGGQRHNFYVEQLENLVDRKRGEVRSFTKVGDGMEEILFKLNEYDNLTLIVSLFTLHEILHGWKKDLKVIQDKFVHEKYFRFLIIVFTTRSNSQNAIQLCQKAGFEKYMVFTRFGEMLDVLFPETLVPLD